MASIDDIILTLNSDKKELNKLVTEHWNEMMTYASIRSLTTMRIELLSYISAVGTGSKVKKHTKRLNSFFQELLRLEKVELCSSTYIKHILTPAKALRIEFEQFKTESVSKLVSKDDGKKIAKTAKAGVEAIIADLKKAA
jgi:hypothetical protein